MKNFDSYFLHTELPGALKDFLRQNRIKCKCYSSNKSKNGILGITYFHRAALNCLLGQIIIFSSRVMTINITCRHVNMILVRLVSTAIKIKFFHSFCTKIRGLASSVMARC